MLFSAAFVYARDPNTQIPTIGVNAWERGACMTTADYQALSSNSVVLFRTGFNQEEVASLDDTVQRAAQAGVQILPILHTYNAPPTAEPDLTTWAQFCADMAARYGPGGTFWFNGGSIRQDIAYLPIRAWEVWNEPNLSSQWGNLPTSATQYMTLLRRTEEAVRSVDPSAVIVFAGLALKNADANGNGGVTFLQQALAQPGAVGNFQALGAHSYPTLPSDVEGHLSVMRSTLNAAGSSAEIWLTEFGWPTGGTTSGHTAVSVATQDSYLSDTITRVNNQRVSLKLGPVFWFAFRDLTPGSGNPCEAGFAASSWSNYLGLRTSLTSGNTAKPAWTTIGARAAAAAPVALPLPVSASDAIWLKQP